MNFWISGNFKDFSLIETRKFAMKAETKNVEKTTEKYQLKPAQN